jgi:hypothetical protein
MERVIRRFFRIVLRGGLSVSPMMLGGSVLAQSDTSTVVISGTVVDPLRKPMEGVEVRLLGDTVTRFTSQTGTFRLFARRNKETILQLRRPGYNSQILQIDGDWSGAILMTPGAFELPDVNVTVRNAKPARFASTSKYDDYFRRRHIGFGQFITRADISRRSPLHTHEILEGQAGIRVAVPFGQDPVVSFARCREYPPKINVYLDGRKLMPAAHSKAARIGTESPMQKRARDPEILGMIGEVLSRISPSEIEFLEIFRGPGELPAEFNDGNCGAIAIWTRDGSG